jgi:hypothetical protein
MFSSILYSSLISVLLLSGCSFTQDSEGFGFRNSIKNEKSEEIAYSSFNISTKESIKLFSQSKNIQLAIDTTNPINKKELENLTLGFSVVKKNDIMEVSFTNIKSIIKKSDSNGITLIPLISTTTQQYLYSEISESECIVSSLNIMHGEEPSTVNFAICPSTEKLNKIVLSKKSMF